MKIDRLEVINLRFAYAPRGGFTCAGGYCDARVTSLVLVHTDTGQVGLGSVYSHPGLVWLVVKEQLEPMLRGADASDVEALWNKMYKVTRWYGRKGAAMSAVGGVDTALWDLRGKAQGKPVWELLGGTRDTCPAYASALLWNTLDGLAQEAAGLIERGFRRVKMRLGRDEDYDVQGPRAVKQAIGQQCDLLCDASMRYHVALARRIGEQLAKLNVFWFEEPFQPEDVDAYAALRGSVGVRIAAGENEFGEQGFAELIRARAVDIVQPDACRCGGITEVMRVGRLAQQAQLGLATHTWSDSLAIVANAHAVSALPCGLTVEVDQSGNPFVEELLVEPLLIRDGQLQLSRAPGLGVELNQTVVDRYRMADPLRMPEGHYSDMVFGPSYWRPAGPYQEDRQYAATATTPN